MNGGDIPVGGGEEEVDDDLARRLVPLLERGVHLLRVLRLANVVEPKVDVPIETILSYIDAILPVEVVEADELLAELESPDGVAEVVERRRPEADTHDVGDDHHQGAAPARLGGQPYHEGELARVCNLC